MFGGGDQKRTSKDSEISPQLPNNPRAMVISDPSATLDLTGQNSPHVFAGEDMQNGVLSQQAESIIIHSKKLQDDLQELGQKIKHHEDNVKYSITQKIKLEESVLDMTATLEKYHKTSFSTIQNRDLDLSKSEQETLGNILKHEKSAAALLCMIKSQPESQAFDHPLTKDVLGIVATLGKVVDDNLSREDVKFPIGFERLSLPEKYLEIEDQMKETKWKKNRMSEDLQREQSYLDHAKANYEMKKQEFVKFIAERSMYTAQVAHASAPR